MESFISRFVNTIAPSWCLDGKLRVLDVGSQSVSGGTYKALFPEDRFEYVGLDVTDGNNVDIVLPADYNWEPIETDSFHIVISGQAFEHTEFFWLTMDQMVRSMTCNGLLCLIAPNGFPLHRYPVDCYRFWQDAMIALARYTSLKVLDSGCVATADAWLMAQKQYSGPTRLPDFTKYRCEPLELEQ